MTMNLISAKTMTSYSCGQYSSVLVVIEEAWQVTHPMQCNVPYLGIIIVLNVYYHVFTNVMNYHEALQIYHL